MNKTALFFSLSKLVLPYFLNFCLQLLVVLLCLSIKTLKIIKLFTEHHVSLSVSRFSFLQGKKTKGVVTIAETH